MSKVLYRDLNSNPHTVISSKGSYLYLQNGHKILDAAGGAAVTSVGHSNKYVVDSIIEQLETIQFVHSSLFTTNSAENLANIILLDPKYEALGLAKVTFYNSGSEANETALKLTRQAMYERGEPERTKVISRNMSYHGNTFGAMSVSGHKIRNQKFKDMFDENTFHKVDPPFYLHYSKDSETEEQFLDRLLKQLDDKFLELGPQNVMAFFAETMIGGTVGCVVPPKGYLEGCRAICDKYGAYLIYDEIMCGSGRLGSFFAWEEISEDCTKVVPDILTFGKGIGSGYLPLSGIVVKQNVLDDLNKGSGVNMSRHTYQSHPVCCAAGYAVQKYIRDHNLYENIRKLGPKLGKALELLKSDSRVFDVRGHGFFWCVELMKDKSKAIPFAPEINFSDLFAAKCFDLGLTIIPCHGTVDGFRGDHVLICPSFDIDSDIVQEISRIMAQALKELDVY